MIWLNMKLTNQNNMKLITNEKTADGLAENELTNQLIEKMVRDDEDFGFSGAKGFICIHVKKGCETQFAQKLLNIIEFYNN